MALIPCVKCNGVGTVSSPQGTIECPECRGIGQKETDWVGTINKLQFLTDEVELILKRIEPKVDVLTTSQTAQDNEIADIKDKVNDIKEKVDEIKTIVEA